MYRIIFGILITDSRCTSVELREDSTLISPIKEVDLNRRTLLIRYPPGAFSSELEYPIIFESVQLEPFIGILFQDPPTVNGKRIYKIWESINTISFQLLDNKYGESEIVNKDNNLIVYINEADFNLIEQNYSRLEEILDLFGNPVYVEPLFKIINTRYIDLNTSKTYTLTNKLIYRGKKSWVIDSVFAAARVIEAVRNIVKDEYTVSNHRTRGTIPSGTIDYEIVFEPTSKFKSMKGPNFGVMGYDQFRVRFKFVHEDLGVLMSYKDLLKHNEWLAQIKVIQFPVHQHDEEATLSIGLFWDLDNMSGPLDTKLEKKEVNLPCLQFEAIITSPLIKGDEKFDSIIEAKSEILEVETSN